MEKLKIATESTLSAEERAARMDELLEEEERVQKEYDQKLKALRDLQFRKTQELHECKVKERNTEAEIQVSTLGSCCKHMLYHLVFFNVMHTIYWGGGVCMSQNLRKW